MERGWVVAGLLVGVTMLGACSAETPREETVRPTSIVERPTEASSTTAIASPPSTTTSPPVSTARPSTTAGSPTTSTRPPTPTTPPPTTTRRPFEQCPAPSTKTIEPYVAGTVPVVTFVSWYSERACLVAVETATGKVMGAVYSSPDGRRTGNIVLDPTGTSLVLSEVAGCTSRVVRVDLRNGARTDLGPGSLAGLRYDGLALAYRPTIDDPSFLDEPVSIHAPCLRDLVVVRDLVSGGEQVFDANDATKARVAWSPDGRYLAWDYYSNTDVGHALILELETGRRGLIDVDPTQHPWVSGGECCGTGVLGWTAANRPIVRLYPYVMSLDAGRSSQSSVGSGTVWTDGLCGVCVVVDRKISRDNPDHEGDRGHAGTVTLRAWGTGWQIVGPGGVVDLPGADPLWPAGVMFPSFE